MLSILRAHTTIPHNIQRDNLVLISRLDKTDDGELLDSTLHRDVVGAGVEDQIGEKRGADFGAVDAEVHGDIAQVESYDGGVGDLDSAEHVGAVREGLLGAEKDF
jgi:hypothetical protein